MTNKEAIANLNHIYGFLSSDIQRSLDIAIKALEEKMWTPTNEMLPEENGCYLVMWKYKLNNYKGNLFYEIAEYFPEEDGFDCEWSQIEQAGEAGAEIVAWMPLPERYEPKEKENG